MTKEIKEKKKEKTHKICELQIALQLNWWQQLPGFCKAEFDLWMFSTLPSS